MKRALLFTLLLGAGIAAGFATWRLLTARAPEPTPAGAVAARPASPAAALPPGPAPSEAEAESPPAPEAPPHEPTLEELGGPWALVDMDEIRQAMPYNLYWQEAAPTDDARLVRQREEDRERWNVEYGKVLSGNATEEEIQAYYAHRQKLFADYVEFVSYVLDHYQDELPEQDVGLLELARRLNLARLEEIPRRLQEATERKQQQDAAREAWLADEADFESAEPEAHD